MTYGVRHSYSSLLPGTLGRFVDSHRLFIETGSNIGEGIKAALDAGFHLVHSVEEVETLHKECRRRYARDPNVVLHLADSPVGLRAALNATYGWRAVVYLDAHSVERNPLMEELAVLAEEGFRRDHTLLIDDVRMFGTPDWHGLSREEILAGVFRVNPGYLLRRLDTAHAHGDLLVCELPE